MYAGTIAQLVTSNISRNGSNGAFSVKLMLWSLLIFTSVMRWNTPRARGASRMWNSMMENRTFSAVKGLPSCHFTLGWSSIV
jgi:hypothetical protein